jgi:alkylation response protein AidB-like acyl-CoA dehydrogenase
MYCYRGIRWPRVPAIRDSVFDLALSGEQEQLQKSVRALLEKESGPDLVRAMEPLGFSPSLWDHLAQLGVPEMAVPENAGGGGAGLLDAVVVAELAGEFLAPVPLVEGVVANRLLARLGTPESMSVLADAIRGAQPTTLALSAPIDDELRWVPAGAVADRVVARQGHSVVVAIGPAPGAAIPNLGSLPLAHRALASSHLVAEGPDAIAAFDLALDEWRVMMAAWLVGAGRRALQIAVDYTAGVRRPDRFLPVGRPPHGGPVHRLGRRPPAPPQGSLGGRPGRRPKARAGADGGQLRGRDLRTGGHRCPALSWGVRLHARVRHPALPAADQGVCFAQRRPGP